MTLDCFPDLLPAPGEVLTEELALTEDTLVKAFALGPNAELAPHEHADSTNVFHICSGEVTVIQDGEEESVEAPGVVVHERGAIHGARNDSDEIAVFTATFCPRP